MRHHIGYGDRIVVVVEGKVLSGLVTGCLENNNREPVIEMDLDISCQNEVVAKER